MGAPKDNQFWKVRASCGRDKIFETPESLWSAANEYFEWVEANPLMESKVAQFQGEQVTMVLPKMRAMTIEGLCLFLGVTCQTLNNYGSNDSYEDFFGVVGDIKSVIYNQKFIGAAADLLNANIIARDLGLSDKKDHTSSDGSMSQKPTTIELVSPSVKSSD